MAKKPCSWSVVEKSRNVHELKLLKSLSSGGEAWILWQSDEHWDHPKCDLKKLKEHHQEAAERGAAIVKVGDTFCVMQGKGDPRGDKGSVRPEHFGGNYLDLVVDTASDWYGPYKDYIKVVGIGNHESATFVRHETCLIERLCQSLRNRGGQARKGGYSGWIRLRIGWNHTKHSSFVAYYHHGFGGGGPASKGTPDFPKVAEWIDADAIVSGHIHYKNYQAVQRARLNDHGVVVQKDLHYVRCGTYKNEFEDGYAGYHIENGRGPRTLGGWWQRVFVKNDQIQSQFIEAN